MPTWRGKHFEIEELYSGLLYITEHQIGFDPADEVSQEKIVDYLKKAFNIDDETHERVLEETRQMEAPKMHLNVEVMEAKELVPKDANGKSDPFCILYLDSVPTKRYNTAVKTETLTPVWREHFEMPLNNPENDVLNVEVWDFDAAETVPEKMSKVKSVKGMRGLVKLAKEIAITATNGNHDNEFIGSVGIPLQEIPVGGRSAASQLRWYALDKKNKSKRRGMLRLRLGFSSEGRNPRVAFQEHRHLLRILLLNELESAEDEQPQEPQEQQEQQKRHYWWTSERWSAPARVVLAQHGLQRGLARELVALAEWLEFGAAHCRESTQLSFELFEQLSGELREPLAGLPEEQARLFWDATRRILYSGLNLLRKLRRLTVNKESVIRQLLAVIRMISNLSSMSVPDDVRLFPLKMYSWFPAEITEDDRVGIAEALKFAVIRGAAEWFEYVVSNNNLEGDSDEEALRSHIKIIQLIRIDLQRAMEIYEKLFVKSINFPYTKTLYVTYEKRVSDMCMVIVEDICGRLKRIEVETSEDPELNLGTTLFELYLAVQRFAGVGKNLCPEEDERDGMKVQSYHEWFKAGVAHWLEIALYKALKRIERAVEFDDLRPVDASVRYSSSAVDTLTIFYQVKVFWSQLAWPDVEGAYTFIAKMVDDICKCSVAYADRMSAKAEASQLEAADGYNVSGAWCTAVNNIDYVRTSIEPLAKDLGLEEVIEALADQRSQQGADRCRATLQLIVDNAKDTIGDRVLGMLETIARRMAPAMSRYLMEGAELPATTSSHMDKLLEYLDSNLATLHGNLSRENFDRILQVVWDIMADSLSQLVHSNLERRRPPSYYSNLHKTLHTLVQFFNLGNEAGGGDEEEEAEDGKASPASKVKSLDEIERLLRLHGLESAELVHQYYVDRLQEQSRMASETNGLLTVKAYFFNDSLLNILVLNARHLKSLDNNGKCDSYIKIRLSPENEFIGVKSYKTSVQKDTQFPLYEESFSIPLTPEQRKLEGAMVVFEVKDKDFLRTRFLAECFLPFEQVQETDSHDGFNELEQVHLKLSRPTLQSSEVVDVLARRKGDSLASNFVARLQSKASSS